MIADIRFRIFWKGRDVAVSTRFRDDGPAGRNSRLVNAKAILIEEKLRTGADLHRALLEVLGDCPPRLMPAPSPAVRARTMRDYYEEWIKKGPAFSSAFGLAEEPSVLRSDHPTGAW